MGEVCVSVCFFRNVNRVLISETAVMTSTHQLPGSLVKTHQKEKETWISTTLSDASVLTTWVHCLVLDTGLRPSPYDRSRQVPRGPHQRSRNFFKGQRVSALGSAWHMAAPAATQLCVTAQKQSDNLWTNEHICVPIKLHSQKQVGPGLACRLAFADPSLDHPWVTARQLLTMMRPCSAVLIIKLLSFTMKFTLRYSPLW